MKLLLLLLLSLILPLFRSQKGPRDSLGAFGTLENEQISSITLGSGVDYVLITLPQGGSHHVQIEIGQLSDRPEDEWTFEVKTDDGEFYTFADENGELCAIGSNGKVIDATGSYASYMNVDGGDAADVFGEYVVDRVKQIYNALEVEQMD